MIDHLILDLIFVLGVIIVVVLILRFARPRRWPETPTVDGIGVRYVLYVGPFHNATEWAKRSGFGSGQIIPIQRADELLWGRRGPIAVVTEDGYLESLTTREREQALHAIQRVEAINVVTWSEQGGDDAA